LDSSGREFVIFADQAGRNFIQGSAIALNNSLIFKVLARSEYGIDDACQKLEVPRMKLKRTLIMSLLGGAMLALLPMTAPAFAQSSYSANSNYIVPVDWWWDHYKGDRDGYANHGWHKGYYEYGGKRYACDRARSLQEQVWRDRSTGHPAAAQDVQEEANQARANCYNRN
jgi:hypothetical protein